MKWGSGAYLTCHHTAMSPTPTKCCRTLLHNAPHCYGIRVRELVFYKMGGLGRWCWPTISIHFLEAEGPGITRESSFCRSPGIPSQDLRLCKGDKKKIKYAYHCIPMRSRASAPQCSPSGSRFETFGRRASQNIPKDPKSRRGMMNE